MSNMQHLAQAITANVEALTKSLQKNGVSEPNVSRQESLFPALDADGEEVRSNLLSAITQLERLVLGPYQYIFDLCTGVFDIGILQTLTRFNIPRFVPVDGSIAYSELAELTGLREDILVHLIREAIVTLAFLAEDKQGNVCHSPASVVWHTKRDLADAMEWNLDHKPQAAMAEADARLADPLGRNEAICGFSQSRKDGEYESIYKYMASSPVQARKFQALMRAMAIRDDLAEILRLRDWSDMEGKTVVDVGGSTGHIAAVLARQYPGLQVVVQDLPEVVKRATGPDAPTMPPNLSFAAYNFFTPQPVVAEAYMFRSVFHNWSDTNAQKILGSLVPALRPGTKVFLVERIMPSLGSGSLYQEKQARQLDATMSGLMNGRCRELEELKAIMEKVEPRLKFRGIEWSQITTVSDPRSHSLVEWQYE